MNLLCVVGMDGQLLKPEGVLELVSKVTGFSKQEWKCVRLESKRFSVADI